MYCHVKRSRTRKSTHRNRKLHDSVVSNEMDFVQNSVSDSTVKIVWTANEQVRKYFTTGS